MWSKTFLNTKGCSAFFLNLHIARQNFSALIGVEWQERGISFSSSQRGLSCFETGPLHCCFQLFGMWILWDCAAEKGLFYQSQWRLSVDNTSCCLWGSHLPVMAESMQGEASWRRDSPVLGCWIMPWHDLEVWGDQMVAGKPKGDLSKFLTLKHVPYPSHVAAVQGAPWSELECAP